MDERNISRIEYLRGQIVFLTTKKQKLLALASSSQSSEAREAWARRLDSTIVRLRKHSAELAALEEHH